MIRFRCTYCHEDLTVEDVTAWQRSIPMHEERPPLAHPNLNICRNNLVSRLVTVEDELNKRGKVWVSVHFSDQSP